MPLTYYTCCVRNLVALLALSFIRKDVTLRPMTEAFTCGEEEEESLGTAKQESEGEDAI